MTEIIPEAILKQIIQDGNDQQLVITAEQIGKQLAALRLTTSQIRGIFGTVRRIEMDWKEQPDGIEDLDQQSDREHRRAQREFALLKPRLAYQAKRERGRGVDYLQQILAPAIDLVENDSDRFKNFVDFFEAILAYHRANGGSNN